MVGHTTLPKKVVFEALCREGKVGEESGAMVLTLSQIRDCRSGARPSVEASVDRYEGRQVSVA